MSVGRAAARRSTCRSGQIEQALKLLEIDGAVARDGGRFSRTAEPWEQDEERIERVIATRRAELAEMQAYVDHDGCCMEFLARAAGRPGGRTVRPMRQRRGPADVARGRPRPGRRGDRRSCGATCGRSRRASSGSPTRCRGLKGKIDPPNELGIALCVYGDAGWGRDVQRGREVDGRFDRELVVGRGARRSATAGTRSRAPEWVDGGAVASAGRALRRRLRARARARARPAVRRLPRAPPPTREPQDGMLNSVQQLAERASRSWRSTVRSPSRPGPVLLVDDLVDSGWTLTVAGWLLREAGSGPVHPFALAASSGRE